jgi:hypothetical protein
MVVNTRRSAVIAGAIALCIGVALLLTSREKKEPTPPLISCAKMSYEARLARDEIKHKASPDVGGMGMFHYEITHDAPSGQAPQTETVHATVALWTPQGRLLGSDRGEFGGELVLANENDPKKQPKNLYYANIEDLFLMKYGVLATTGYFHLDQDVGSILLVTFSKSGGPQVEEIFKLPAGVQTSWVTTDDKLLVNTSKGTFAISSPTKIEQVRCKAHWWQII